MAGRNLFAQPEQEMVQPAGRNLLAEPEQETEIPLTDALTQGVKNLPSSTLRQVTSLLEAVKHPKQTWEGLKSLSKDIYKQQVGVALQDMGFDLDKIKFEEGAILEDINETEALDAVVDDFKNTYGSYANFKKTIAEDPSRILVDLGSVIAPAAKGVKVTAAAANLPKIAKTAEVISKGAALADPITAGAAGTRKLGAVTSKLTGNVFKGLSPTGLYKSATKMSTKLSETERGRLAQIALDEGVTPTLKGLDNIDDKISTLDNKIFEMIEDAEKTGTTMPLAKLFKDFDTLKSKRLLSSKPKEGIAAIDRIKKGIIEANAKIQRGRLTPKEAQKLKQTIYKDLNGYYDQVKNSPASVEAQKSVARAAKTFLEEIVPEIKALNKKDGDLISLRRAIEGPASRIANRDIFGLGVTAKVGTGAALGVAGGPEIGALTTAGGLALGILDDPVVKSKLAIVLNKLQKEGAKINPDHALIRLGLYEASRLKGIGEE